MGELLNTQLVSKTDIQGKEMRFMFGHKLNHVDQRIQELQHQLDNIDESDTDAHNNTDIESGSGSDEPQTPNEEAKSKSAINPRRYLNGMDLAVPLEFNQLQKQIS